MRHAVLLGDLLGLLPGFIRRAINLLLCFSTLSEIFIFFFFAFLAEESNIMAAGQFLAVTSFPFLRKCRASSAVLQSLHPFQRKPLDYFRIQCGVMLSTDVMLWIRGTARKLTGQRNWMFHVNLSIHLQQYVWFPRNRHTLIECQWAVWTIRSTSEWDRQDAPKWHVPHTSVSRNLPLRRDSPQDSASETFLSLVHEIRHRVQPHLHTYSRRYCLFFRRN